METVGKKLQQARLAKKLEVEQIAQATRIPPERIIDLEAEEYSHFPNFLYAKSFLAKYAKFLCVDIQEELDNFVSPGDYQCASSALPPRFVRSKQARQAKVYRVPALVVVALVLTLLVGAAFLSYLSLNISGLAGSQESAASADVQDKLAAASRTPPVPLESATEWLPSLDQASYADERAAVALTAPHNRSLQEEATPTPYGARIENGVEVRRALPVDPMQNSAASEVTASPGLSTLVESAPAEVRAQPPGMTFQTIREP